jgi:hypothetical protein
MRNVWTSVALLTGLLLVVGCGPQTAPSTGDKKPVAKEGDGKHSGWWCDEHGVPEHECSMCSAKAAKEFKAKGDWCDKHDRAKSQCFICDPSLKDKYAAQYEAKYNKKPPEPTDNMPEKKDAAPDKK